MAARTMISMGSKDAATTRIYFPSQLTTRSSESSVAPVAGQGFLNGTPVPIKLGPPPGGVPTGYMVHLQRKDTRGQWVDHGVIPVGAGEA